MSAATHAYVGKHGRDRGYSCAVVDVPGEEKRTAESVAEFISDGYAVSRVTLIEARRGLKEYGDAQHRQNESQQKLFETRP